MPRIIRDHTKPERGVNGPVTTYKLSDLPQAEQQRILSLQDAERKSRRAWNLPERKRRK